MLTSLGLAAAVLGHHWFGGAWLFFLVPLFWVGIIALIVALVAGSRRRHHGRGHFGPGHWGPGHPMNGAWGDAGVRSAEATLASRFANGDIDEKEYRARLEVLRASGSAAPSA